MVAYAFVKLMLVGSVLYLSLGWSDASFAKITSVASDAVKESLPASVYGAAFGNGAHSNRFKREVVTKKMEDPKSCISQCHNNETSAIVTATVRNMGRLIGLTLQNIKGDETDTPEKEAAFKKQIEEQVIANMGPFFADLCKITKQAEDCYSGCPDSKLKSVETADTSGSETFCEPGKNWKTFSDYWYALNCTNTTEENSSCEKQCGKAVPVANVTHLKVNDEEESEEISLTYENDKKKNTAAVGPACKAITCQLECYKPIMSANCGAKAYDMYNRMTKLEPTSSLRILNLLGAVDQNSDCKQYQ